MDVLCADIKMGCLISTCTLSSAMSCSIACFLCTGNDNALHLMTLDSGVARRKIYVAVQINHGDFVRYMLHSLVSIVLSFNNSNVMNGFECGNVMTVRVW